MPASPWTTIAEPDRGGPLVVMASRLRLRALCVNLQFGWPKAHRLADPSPTGVGDGEAQPQ